MLRERSVLAAIEVFHEGLGNVFQLALPGFSAVMLVGPEAARFLLVTSREDVRWRSEGDPVTRLLREGVLVIDGEDHDRIRNLMNPSLHRQMLNQYAEAMVACTDQVCDTWQLGSTLDMLVEMRKIALLILVQTLFRVDFHPELERLWKAILKTLAYISPGLWMLWSGVPRPGYRKALAQMDDYLYQVISMRRRDNHREDMLGALIEAGLDDGLIRDQLLTMLIAGHDTSTALLSWALYLLGKHPEAMQKAQDEAQHVLGHDTPRMEHIPQLTYLGQVIDEALRLYPPIHIGSRIAATDLEFDGRQIKAGTRVVYSIYLTQRMKTHWQSPAAFQPERFAPGLRQEPYTFLPFGGGPRNCIGAAFSQVEAKLVLARLLQRHDFTLQAERAYAYMGATLEPRPGVLMQITHRNTI
jgi:cytochrome P450